MNRRETLVALAAFGAASRLALAQPAERKYRIGYIQIAAPHEMEHLIKALDEGLRDLGYVEGRNIEFVRRFAHGKQERLPELAQELVRLKVDVIVTGANPAVAAAKQATGTIPIVMSTSRDPVGSGFVASLARPGGNVTGLTSDPTPDVQGKRLELLKEAVPKASRMALLWNPLPPGAGVYREAVESAARKLGVALKSMEVRGRDEFEGAFAAAVRDRADAVVVLPDPLFYTARAQVVSLAMKHRLPAVFSAREYVEIGGLISYGVSLTHQFGRAAVYVDRIFKGSKPGDLPIEQATKFELAVNLGTAKAFGITMPQSVMMRADEVIR